MGTRHAEQHILPGRPYLVSNGHERTHDVGSKYPCRYIANNLYRAVLRPSGGNHANQPVSTQSVILTHTAGSSRQPKTAWVRLLIWGGPLNRDDIHAAAVLIERAIRDPNTHPHSASQKPSPCRDKDSFVVKPDPYETPDALSCWKAVALGGLFGARCR